MHIIQKAITIHINMLKTLDMTRQSGRGSFNARFSLAGTIESSVTRLLVSTKHLLESLTQWAHQDANDKYVSDAYVKLGNDFRAAIKAFTSAGVDVSDLGDVPKALRIVLESALSEAPTQENLDKFLPNIRGIVVNLLSSLKVKQNKLKSLTAEKDILADRSGIPSHDERKPLSSLQRQIASNQENKKSSGNSRYLDHKRISEFEPIEEGEGHSQSSKKGSNALAQLQNSNIVLRRASKRFSAYQFAKLANSSPQQVQRTKEPAADPLHDAGVTTTDTRLNSSLTIFLLMGNSTKKVRIERPVTLASLRLLFVEKFSFSPKSSSFPELYICQSNSSVVYELEENAIDAELIDNSILSLREHSLPDEKPPVFQFGEFRTMLEDFKESLEKRLTNLEDAIRSPPAMVRPRRNSGSSVDRDFVESALRKLSATLSIINSRRVTLDSQLELFHSQVAAIKDEALKGSPTNSNREYMDLCYGKLSEDSDSLLTKVDDLQDHMEALRKDVAIRGVRLSPRDLQLTEKEISNVSESLFKLKSYIHDGKPSWRKIWESELDRVCEEQQFFNLQDDLTIDLGEDIKKLEETFSLIRQCSAEQNRTYLKRSNLSAKIGMADPGRSLHEIKEAILGEVCGLIPDHNVRLEAIKKAEKSRTRQRANWEVSEFQEELGNFVEDGKLKKSGGIEDLEKRRQAKNEENLKSTFGII